MAKRTYQIEFHPETIRETHEAIEWYRQRNVEAANEFRSLVKSAEELVVRSPE